MLPTNESGETTTIENVFHSINTRLINIKSGLNNLGVSYSGYEYGYSYEESISDIQSKVYAFPPAKVIGAIHYSLQLITKIQQQLELINVEKQPTNSWISNEGHIEEIKREMTQYELYLEKTQDELLFRLEEEENLIPNFEKIKINLLIEQFAGIIYFLDNDQVFKAKTKPLCRAVSKIFCQKNGEEINPEYLNNQVYQFKYDGTLVSLWTKKFQEYIKQSEVIPKKKK